MIKLLPNCIISFDSCSSVEKFNSFITFSLLVNAVHFSVLMKDGLTQALEDRIVFVTLHIGEGLHVLKHYLYLVCDCCH